MKLTPWLKNKFHKRRALFTPLAVEMEIAEGILNPYTNLRTGAELRTSFQSRGLLLLRT